MDQFPSADARELRSWSDSLRRGGPFALVAAVGLAAIPLGQAPSSWLVVAVVLALTPALFLAEMLAPWQRLPSDLHAIPLVGAVVAVELLRQTQGGTLSGYTPLFVLPIVWASLYGARRHVAFVGIAISAAVAGSILSHTGPVEGAEVRRAILLGAVAFLIGFSISKLVREMRSRAAAAERLALELGQREHDLRLLVRVSRDAIVRFDTSGTFLYASPAARDVYGWEPEELVGTSAFIRIHPDDLHAMLAGGLGRPQLGPDTAISSFRFLRKDGTYGWVEGYRVAIHDQAGAVVEFQSSVRNIDDRRRAEADQHLAERRFEDAFANAPIGIALVGLDGAFISANDALCEMLGRDRDALLASTFQQLTHPDDLAADLELVRSALAAEIDEYALEKRYIRPDGTLVPARLHVSLVRDEGRPLYFISQVVDVSELTDALTAARTSELRFRSLLAAAPAAVLETRTDGTCIFANDEWVRLSGLTREQSLGHGWEKAIHRDDIDGVIRSARAGAEENAAWEKGFRLVRPDGTLAWVAGRAIPLADEKGTVTGFLSAGQDVTERRLAEESLRASEANLKAVADAIRTVQTSADARSSICQAAARLSDAASVSLLELDGRGVKVSSSTDPALIGATVAPDEPSGAAVVMATGERFAIEDVSVRPDLSARLAELGLRGCVFEPVRRGGTVVGVLSVSWARPLQEVALNEIHVVGLLATEAGTVIERGDLLHQLGRLARRDALTGLENRRVWDEELTREIARADRAGRPLSIAVIDIDRFKQFNDSRGHQAGDDVLVATAHVWAATLRTGDRLVRYGGEEFALLLPDCDLASASAITDRLRELVQGGPTCSAGIAQLRAGEDAASLFARADSALYRAKRTGRNRVALAAA